MDTYQQDSSKNNSLEKEYHLPNLLVELRASNEISVQDSINIEEAVKKEMSRIYSGLKRRE
jgi:hypothetical protein